MELKRIVVTGIGALTPIGNNLDDYWNNLLAGVSGAGPITQFDASKFRTRFACEIKNFDPTQYLDKKEARKLDRFAQLALVVSDQAMADAGLNKENINPNKSTRNPFWKGMKSNDRYNCNGS
jgi:3-oxoacyl-[acyl-carrier-protein] synthase II